MGNPFRGSDLSAFHYPEGFGELSGRLVGLRNSRLGTHRDGFSRPFAFANWHSNPAKGNLLWVAWLRWLRWLRVISGFPTVAYGSLR
jgi:hypothetical protein